MAKVKNEPAMGTTVVHAQAEGGSNHIVGVKALHVMLVEDSSCWFAQGLEIDYAAVGLTLDEAKNNFANGLTATIHEHLLLHGGIDNLLKPAKQSAWEEYYEMPTEGISSKLDMLSAHQVLENLPQEALADRKESVFPFDIIKYLKTPGMEPVPQCA